MSVDVPVPPDERLTPLGFRVAVILDGATEVDSVTVPAKLLMLARLIVVVFDEPKLTMRLGRMLDMLKSGPTLRGWVALLLVPIWSVTVSFTV